MQQLVRVQKCNDDKTVLVIPVADGLCHGTCWDCTGCKNRKRKLRRAENPIDADLGQVVVLQTNYFLLTLIRICCLLPLLLLLAGLRYGGIWGGATGFLMGFVAFLWLAAREKSAYTITGAYKKPGEKGDSNLD